MNICSCLHEACPNLHNCRRYKLDGELMDFKVICKESNNYEYLIKINKDLETCKLQEPKIEPKIEPIPTPINIEEEQVNEQEK